MMMRPIAFRIVFLRLPARAGDEAGPRRSPCEGCRRHCDCEENCEDSGAHDGHSDVSLQVWSWDSQESKLGYGMWVLLK
jgi:hypothetical protein